ncbi:hypothetical protein [Bifidobacterium sp. SO1]|uniref:hypothetical protein n=1 Tax=Bifidobacterium sp. SO1 TaxID=2809029 RepID=UPI001BDBD098|nr:hypothetical protein [Bifidobacterium sp. SO1]MBT1162895.1 hypothetical protein [Bifidobacterium sp. SO1]
MGYPWGPENWPTIERLEPDAERLGDAFWSEYHRLVEQRRAELDREARSRPIIVNLTVNGSMSIEQVKQAARKAAETAVHEADEPYLSEGEQTDLLGMAFARALRSVGELEPDEDMERFMQDLFDVLEHRVIHKADNHENPFTKNV